MQSLLKIWLRRLSFWFKTAVIVVSAVFALQVAQFHELYVLHLQQQALAVSPIFIGPLTQLDSNQVPAPNSTSFNPKQEWQRYQQLSIWSHPKWLYKQPQSALLKVRTYFYPSIPLTPDALLYGSIGAGLAGLILALFFACVRFIGRLMIKPFTRLKKQTLQAENF